MSRSISLLLLLVVTIITSTLCISLKDTSSVFMGTQALSFCGQKNILQGRWDGSFLISDVSSQYGSVTYNYGFTQGVEAVGCMQNSGRTVYFQTLTASSFLAFTFGDGQEFHREMTYDSAFDMINAFLATDSQNLITGHASGFILVWKVKFTPTDVLITLDEAIDVSSSHPVFTIRNIRALKQWRDFVITASEDGDVCVVDIKTGQVLARQRYDAAAERGINDIDIIGDVLVLGNCATENSKDNMYLFQLVSEPRGISIVPRDKLMLPDASGVRFAFNFNVGVGLVENNYYWAASVQGGLLYHGTLVSNGTKFQLDKEPLRLVASAAAALTTDNMGRIAVAADDSVRVLTVGR